MTELEHLQAVVLRMAEEHFGCPMAQVSHHARNAYANRITTCKAEFDALRNAIGVPYESYTEQQAEIINRTGA